MQIHRSHVFLAVFVFAAFGNLLRADVFTNTITFSNKPMQRSEFFVWIPQDSLPSDATLLTVSVNATLNESVMDTFASDLTVYVDRLPLFGSGGRLQIGGTSNLQAPNRLAWANGHSATPGTTVEDTKDVSIFNIGLSDAQVWYGNGFGFEGSSAVFTGTLTLTYSAAVPEPSGLLLAACGLAGLFAFRRYRL
jgi:PEP-CTERM motif